MRVDEIFLLQFHDDSKVNNIIEVGLIKLVFQIFPLKGSILEEVHGPRVSSVL